MAHEESLLETNESKIATTSETQYVLDGKVLDFLEVNEVLSKLLDASDLISIILEYLDSEE